MDSVFHRVGTCGCFQVSHVFCIQLVRMAHAWSMYLMAFGNYEPPWECVHHNSTSSGNRDGTTWNTTTISGDPLTRKAHQFMHISLLGIHSSNSTHHNDNNLNFRQGTCGDLPICDQVRFDPTSVTLVTEFGLICDQAYIPSLIIAVQMSGMVVGAYLGGQLGESYGRKVSLYASLAALSVSCLVAAWSVSWRMYACLMFVVGVGEGGVTSSQFVYAMEFLTPKWRGRFVPIPTWALSLLSLSLFVTAFRNLRHVHMLVGSVSSLILLSALWVPESLRWLHVNGKKTEAKKVLEKMMKCNGKSEGIEKVFQKFEEIRCDVEGSIKKYTYLELFRYPRLRMTTIKCLIIGFLLSMSYYTLGFSVKALSGDFYTNFIISSGLELPFLILVLPCINRFGRKFAVIALTCFSSLCTIACVIAFYVTDYETSGRIITYLAIVAKGSSCVAWTTNVVYAGELFPTAIRSLAMGLSNTVSRAGIILGAAIIPSDQESLVIFFIVLSVGMLVSCVIIVTLPETKGRPLEDVLEQTRQPLEDVLEQTRQPTENVLESTDNTTHPDEDLLGSST